MLKGTIAAIAMGCGILVFSPYIGGQANRPLMTVLSAVLCLTALVYAALYINKLWVKKEYRLIKKFIYLMTISIVLCSAIVVLTTLHFSSISVAFILPMFNI